MTMHGIIGGSGLYDLDVFRREDQQFRLHSAILPIRLKFSGQRPRSPPGTARATVLDRDQYRANIWAMKILMSMCPDIGRDP
jgi:purine nucleoside phosphorylase